MSGWSGSNYQRLFALRDFRRFWLGYSFSIVGDAMTRVALTWFVYESTRSAAALGWLMLCYTGPVVAGGLLAGWLLDRLDRRTVMIVDNLVRGSVIGLVPLLHALDRLALWHVYVAAAVYGLLMMIALAGGPTLVPSLVEPRLLATANALEMLSFTLGGVVGPALAGLLIGRIDAPAVVTIDAISYVFFAVALLGIGPVAEPAMSTRQTGEGHGLRQAVRLLIGTPVLLSTTLMFLAFNIGGGVLYLVLPILADQALGGGAGLYGALLSALALGEVASALFVGSLTPARPLGTLICLVQALSGVALLLLFAGTSAVLVGLGLALFGAFSAPMTIWAQTLRMRIIPERLRGRVFALLRTLMQSGTPIGGAAGGVLLPLLGVGTLLGVAVALVTAPGLLGLRVAELRKADG